MSISFTRALLTLLKYLLVLLTNFMQLHLNLAFFVDFDNLLVLFQVLFMSYKPFVTWLIFLWLKTKLLLNRISRHYILVMSVILTSTHFHFFTSLDCFIHCIIYKRVEVSRKVQLLDVKIIIWSYAEIQTFTSLVFSDFSFSNVRF